MSDTKLDDPTVALVVHILDSYISNLSKQSDHYDSEKYNLN
jgi:hypothetical protein